MNAKRVMKQFVILSMLNSAFMGLTSATYVTFLAHYGLDLFEQGVVNFCCFLMLTIMEIPTGVIADMYGRKISYLISCGLASAGLLLYGLSTTMFGFIAAEMVLAIGMTFSSGAFRAWFVDRFHHFKHQESLSTVFARASGFGVVASVVAAIVGAHLYKLSPAAPWFAGAVMSLVAGIVACSCKEEYFVRESSTVTFKIQILKTAFADFRKAISHDGPFRFIVVVSFALHMFVAAPNMQWQPFFGFYLQNEIWFGYVYFGIKVAVFAGTCLAPIVLRHIVCEKKSIMTTQLAIAVSLFVAALCDSFWLAGTAFLIHEMGRGAVTPIADAYLHDNIEARQRATIDSCASMVYRGAGAIGLLFGGFIAKRFGIPFTWMIMSVILATATIAVALKGKK